MAHPNPTAVPQPLTHGITIPGPIVYDDHVTVEIERKKFLFREKRNDRGAFVEIVEDVRGRRDMIVVPFPGLRAFRDAINLILGE